MSAPAIKRPRRSAPRTPTAGARGWPGRGGGESLLIQAPDQFRGTTVQVCGLWPFSSGAGTPMVGVPIGRSLVNQATLCADPISWFQADLISNPSMFVLGLPGLGKSSLLRRIAMGLAAFGVQPMILGDLKPDYVDLIEALGGQVIRLGRGRGYLNVLDASEARAAADRLTGQERRELLADALARRNTLVVTLLSIARGSQPSDREQMFIDRALRVLDDRHAGTPVLGDLAQVIEDGPQEMREIALDRGERSRYDDLTENLLASLRGLMGSGKVGELFSQQSTVGLLRDRPVVFDISAIDDSDLSLQGAALAASWSAGFGAVNVSHALADAGKEPQRVFFCVIDEMWRVLRAGEGSVERADVLTRVNRQRGTGTAMCSHTMSDLQALPRAEDRLKAMGFVERSAIVVCAGLPGTEMPMLTQAVPLSMAEQRLLLSWQNPPAWTRSGRGAAPPGRGSFLLKVGGRPGVPFRMAMTASERSFHDTNRRWHDRDTHVMGRQA